MMCNKWILYAYWIQSYAYFIHLKNLKKMKLSTFVIIILLHIATKPISFSILNPVI